MSGSTSTTSGNSANMTISQAAQALCPVGQVCITNIDTLPSYISVNDNNTFGFMADVFNNSSNTITAKTICQAPITATFDNHYVNVTHTKSCLVIGTKSIPPHTDATVYGPPIGTIYKAVRTTGLLPGHTVAVVTFTYSTTTGVQSKQQPYLLHIWP
jgi:hypothetical protein